MSPSPTARWLVAAISSLTLAISFLYSPSTLPKFELCLLRRMTGVPCPGCGLTRAFCAISHGDPSAALHFNPFGFVFYATALALVAWPFAALQWPELDARLARSKLLYGSAAVLFAAMLVFGAMRACGVLAAR